MGSVVHFKLVILILLDVSYYASIVEKL